MLTTFSEIMQICPPPSSQSAMVRDPNIQCAPVVAGSLRFVPDLLALPYLHDSVLLQHVRQNYAQDLIYVCVMAPPGWGPVLFGLGETWTVNRCVCISMQSNASKCSQMPQMLQCFKLTSTRNRGDVSCWNIAIFSPSRFSEILLATRHGRLLSNLFIPLLAHK